MAACPRIRRTLGRLKVGAVLAALCGVLVMHGVMSDSAMSLASTTPVDHLAMSMPTELTTAMVSGETEPTAADASSALLQLTDPIHSGLTGLCVAILSGGLILPLLALTRSQRRRRHDAAYVTAAASTPSPAVGWSLTAAPSLTSLCISRT